LEDFCVGWYEERLYSWAVIQWVVYRAGLEGFKLLAIRMG
jgi:hypothetical protein